MWIFLFSAKDKELLDGMCPSLEAEGYEIFDIFENDLQGEREPNLWMMLVQKIAVHTVDSLYARNQTRMKFAEAHRDSFFEGWGIED
jgi:Regulator of ribonuclease activity B